MSTELELKIWFSDELEYEKRFVFLLEYIVKTGNFISNFTYFNIAQYTPGNIVTEFPEIESISQMDKILKDYKEDEYKVTVYLPMSCWRFHKSTITKETVEVAVSVCSKNYGNRLGLDRRLEGDANITFLTTGPFTEVIGDKSDKFAAINEKVEENNSFLIDFITNLSINFNVSKMLAFSNSCDYVLHNAHLCYYQRFEELKNDFEFYSRLLKVGNKKYEYQSAKLLQSSKDSYYLSEWRNTEMKDELITRLIKAAETEFNITPKKIEQILASGKYDFFDNDGRLLVLEYPFFANALIDNFVLEAIS